MVLAKRLPKLVNASSYGPMSAQFETAVDASRCCTTLARNHRPAAIVLPPAGF